MRKKTNSLAADLNKLLSAAHDMRTAQQRYEQFPSSLNLDAKKKSERLFDGVYRQCALPLKPGPAQIPSIKRVTLWEGR